MNFSNAIDRFARQQAANGRSAHTRAAYSRDLRAFGAWFGENVALSAITPTILPGF